ncbi:hypothetical protein AeMF1_002479 [Aphanomyces euteiches]|nr:hypothetical protein AeMF1_002479 [Aphanomyces euteiches]KAH9192671.1 hypothetical protein AeNC1_005347 [Aphanomyces euteiches]
MSTDDNQKDEDVVAVGSISNVLRRAFRDYYVDDVDAAWLLEQEHPYVVYATDQMQAIDANLRDKVSQASDLMALLDQRRVEAASKDEQQARELVAQGLVVKAQIPLGPSNFRLDRNELAHFGALASSLVLARDLVADNHARMLDRSGNGPSARIQAAKHAVEVPGYLKTTATVSLRKKATLHPPSTAPEEEEEYITEDLADAGPPPESPKRPKKPKPQPQLSIDQVDANAKILERMQRTLAFRRNPRYDKSNHDINEASPPFQVEPMPVEFTDYDMGGVYEQLVLVKNIGAISGRCRVLPPATAFFMLASVCFPDPSGLVAPGLSCHVRIQFAPDTRADYLDEFVVFVETPSGVDVPLQIPLVARRTPPLLSIPSTLVAASCLVGGTSSTVIPCRNDGGQGRFWCLSQADWIDSFTSMTASWIDRIQALQAVELDPVVELCPFTLSPCDFELARDATIDLTLTYTPTGVGDETATFFVVCDNCLVKSFQITGRGCLVELEPIAINGVSMEHSSSPVAACLMRFDRLLFPPIVACATTTQGFQLMNHTPLDLAFEWQLDGAAADGGHDMAFSVSPAQGILDRHACSSFVVTFAPLRVDSFAAVATLTLCNVPPTCLAFVEPLQHLPLTSVAAMTLTLEGAARAPRIELSPWLVALPEPSTVDRAVNSAAGTIAMINPESIPVAFDWGDHAPVSPRRGTLSPHAQVAARLTYAPSHPGSFGFPLECSIASSPTASVARVEGHVARPRVRFLAPEVDFGLVRVGTSAVERLIFQNDGLATVRFQWRHLEAAVATKTLPRPHSNESLVSASSKTSNETGDTSAPPSLKCTVSFSPDGGTLAPGQQATVEITCVGGTSPERFRGAFQLELLDQENPLDRFVCIAARGEIQCPHVYLSQTQIQLGTTYLGVSVQHTIELVNVSNLAAPFKWSEPQLRHASKPYSVEISPQKGILASKETLPIQMTFTGRAPGYTEVLLACQVQGMRECLGLELTTLQKGLVLSYEVVDEAKSVDFGVVSPTAAVSSSLPKLHFGDDVPLFERKTLRLLIRNHSGITATVAVDARKYNAAPCDATSTTNALEPREHAFQSQAGKAYKSNQATQRQDRLRLSAGLGVAFVCSPSTCVIPPWSHALVEITALNNMAGRYVDEIVVKVDTMPPVRLSATIHVVGCPLSINANCVGLKMPLPAIGSPSFPVLEFGLWPLRADATTRRIQIINTGPIPARLTWKLDEFPDETMPARVVDVALTVQPDGMVQVRIRPYVPTQSAVKLPFQIDPIDQVIPKHGHANFSVSFLPQTWPQVGLVRALLVADADWLHGDMDGRPESNLSMASNGSNQSSAKSLLMGAVGKAMQAVRLTNAMGKAKPTGALHWRSPACVKLGVSSELLHPVLHWDKTTPSLLIFTTWATHDAAHPTRFQTIQLVNRLGTKLSFRLETTGAAFSIKEATTSGSHHPLSSSNLPSTQRSLTFNQYPTPSFTLAPGQSVQVQVHFQAPDHDNDEAPLDGRRRLNSSMVQVTKGQLDVRYSQGSTQTIALQGRVLRPRVVLAPSQFKFGRVHCTQSTNVTIYLSNPTEVDARFAVQHVPQVSTLTTDDPAVFHMAIRNGVVRGPSLPLYTSGALVPTPSPGYAAGIHRPFEVVVTFAPTKPVKYKSRFHFAVHAGQGFDLVLEGEGTLVEQTQPPGSRKLPHAAPLRHSHYVLGKVPE